MTPPDDPELPDSERLPLDALPREIPSPPELVGRIVAELRRRGLVAEPRAPWTRWASAAAALALFVAGLVVGRGIDGRSAPGTASPADADGAGAKVFLLLLYEPRPLVGGSGSETDRVAEYGAWARSLARGGRLVAAEKLAETSALVPARPANGEPAGEPTGFFLVRAADLDEALAIARDCPHVAHGGEIRVRPIDPS